MSGPFACGVTALDEALLATPVFPSEKGLAHRRTKLERVAVKTFRSYLEEAVDQGVVAREAVEPLLAEMRGFRE